MQVVAPTHLSACGGERWGEVRMFHNHPLTPSSVEEGE